jgi:hypothetical protein
MWLYESSTGIMLTPKGQTLGYGFAGQGLGLNNPTYQNVKDIGPLPEGDYDITEWIERDPKLGLGVLILVAKDPTTQFGRSLFRIHGPVDWNVHGLSAFLHSSEGCICIGSTSSRYYIWTSMDRLLRVVAKRA